jgi:hypothetical protein
VEIDHSIKIKEDTIYHQGQAIKMDQLRQKDTQGKAAVKQKANKPSQ